MASPRSLVFQLHKYWDSVEQLCRLSREVPAFEQAQVLDVIRHYSSDEEPAAVLRSLLNADILEVLDRSDALQLHPLVVDFVRGLTHEHELGLSAVLQARINAIKEATALIAKGNELTSMDSLSRGATRLSELFRQIKQQLEQDLHAILEIAERAKSRDIDMPLAKRYTEVLEAYESYVEPINEMMDSTLEGSFYPLLALAINELDRAHEMLEIQGALYTQRLRLRQVAQQAKELRRRGQQVAHQCAETLLPLRDEARQHNRLSTVISGLLGQVRKRGLTATFRGHSATLPLWQRKRFGRVHLGSEIRLLMAEAREFEPAFECFPEAEMAPQTTLAGWVDEQALKEQLKASLPIKNLMQWLTSHYGHLPDEVLLRIYHELTRETLWQSQLMNSKSQTDLHHVRVHYHAHTLQHLEQDGAEQL